MAVFYPFGHPMTNTYGLEKSNVERRKRRCFIP